MTAFLSLRDVSKSFGPVRVIDNVSIDVEPGQVHVLLGENGAGKSTLIKMMAGVYQPDTGQILIKGSETHFPTTKASEQAGIATIHQELNLVPTMSVAENVMLGQLPRRFGLLDSNRLKTQAAVALERVGLRIGKDIQLDQTVGSLGIARQQLVEIAKALQVNARMLILDEPTAALTRAEIAVLFDVVQELRQAGTAMVFISHHLDEIAEIGDTVSVLRDGKFIDQVPATTAEDTLIKLMVGRSIAQQFPRRKEFDGAASEGATSDGAQRPLLEVRGLKLSAHAAPVDFQVKAGEVVGIAGLMGAGRTELLRAIAGADNYAAGQVLVAGKSVQRHDVAAAIRAGIGHVPEDRKAQGLVLDASVNDNIGFATLKTTARSGLVDFGKQRSAAKGVAETLRIRMGSIDQSIRSLSGGNQQKAVFARWIVAGSTVLLLDEPTRGVDVGAKVEIYELINNITRAGGAVVMVSSDLPEVMGMSDRILVMKDGHISGELAAEQASQDRIMALAVQAGPQKQTEQTEQTEQTP